jgi:small subunit ribosomal protein S14
MAKTSTIAKAARRDDRSKRALEKRKALKAKIIDPNTSDDDRRAAMFTLNKMKKDTIRIRHQRRCQATGAPRAVYRKFKLHRITFRNMALQGLLPGVTKASW